MLISEVAISAGVLAIAMVMGLVTTAVVAPGQACPNNFLIDDIDEATVREDVSVRHSVYLSAN